MQLRNGSTEDNPEEMSQQQQQARLSVIPEQPPSPDSAASPRQPASTPHPLATPPHQPTSAPHQPAAPPTMYDVWRTFRETTTAHGIPHVARAQGPVKKAFWTTMMFATISLLLYNISSISIQYFGYPVTVNIKLLHESELTFPSVTVCNMNPVRKSAWEQALVEQAGIGGLQGDVTSGQTRKRRKKRALVDEFCPAGWSDLDGYCYRLTGTQSLTYSAASTACSDEGGSLVSVLSQVELDHVMSMIPPAMSAANGSLWLGLGFAWAWVDGQPLVAYGTPNWRADQPSGDGYCVHTYTEATWNDRKCTLSRPYICEKPANPGGSCEAGAIYSDVTDTCYILSNLSLRWELAKSDCELQNSMLMVIESPEELRVLRNFTNTFSDRLWLGLQLGVSWADGSDVDFTNWAPGHPDNSLHHCALLHAADGSWTTTNCSQPAQGYICKKPEAATTTESVETTTPVVMTTTDPTTTDPLTTPTGVAMTTASESMTTVRYQSSIPRISNFSGESQTGAPTSMSETSTSAASTTDVSDTSTDTSDVSRTTTVDEGGTVSSRPTSRTTVKEQLTTKRKKSTSEKDSSIITTTDMSPTSTSDPTLPTRTTSTTQTTTKSPSTTTKSPTDTSSAEDPTCCCTCCYHNDDGAIKSCGTCGTGCLSNAISTIFNTSGDIATPQTDEPRPIEGSKYPERVQTRETFQETETLTETLAEMSDESRELLGYTAQDFIVDCQFAGADCSVAGFQKFYNPVHGNCFIFNSGWNFSDDLQRSFKTGRRHGLQLVLNIDQDEYIKETGDTAGARLVVHTQGSMPFPEDEGITVTPGQATSVGVRQLMINRLGDRYGSCIDATRENSSRNAYENLYPVGYRATACAKTCYQRNMINTCDCADPYYPISEEAFGRTNISVCKTANITQDDCRYDVTKQFERNELQCACPNPCNETIFALSASTAEWPSDVQKSNMLIKFYPKAPKLFNDPSDPEKYKRNLLKVEVFYEEFNFELMQEKPAYYDSNYMSDLGGVLGLWLGCSILTLIELIEFVMDVVAIGALRKGCCGNKPANRITQIEVAPSPSPSNVSTYSKDDKTVPNDFCNPDTPTVKNDLEYSGFPAAFRSYIEENRLEQEESQRHKYNKADSFPGLTS